MTTTLVPFPEAWPSTAQALHRYALVIGAVPRAHAEPQSHWWHVGLQIEGDALVTVAVSLPEGGTMRLGISPANHTAWVQTGGDRDEFPLDAGLSPNDLADRVLGRAVAAGLADGYDRSRFASDERPSYDRKAAGAYWSNLLAVADVLERRRRELDSPGPIHVWPHHFDMSFEWYGTKQVDAGDGSLAPAQLNLGFNVMGEQYVYSTPWPFDESLLDRALPGDARWHTDGWTGSLLPFEALLADDTWDERVLDYSRAVFDAALPTLTA